MLRARMRASIEVELEAPDFNSELDGQPLNDRGELFLARRYRIIAMGVTNAADRRAIQAVHIQRETDLTRCGDNLIQGFARNSAQDEILAAGQPNITAVTRRQIGDTAHLPTTHQAEINWEAYIEFAGLVLLMHPHVVAFRCRQWQLSQRLQRGTEPRLYQLPEGIDAIVVNHKFQSRLDPRQPVFGS